MVGVLTSGVESPAPNIISFATPKDRCVGIHSCLLGAQSKLDPCPLAGTTPACCADVACCSYRSHQPPAAPPLSHLRSAAVLVVADPLSPTTADLQLNPPAADVKVDKYVCTLRLRLAAGGSLARRLSAAARRLAATGPATAAGSPYVVTVECWTTDCPAQGLTPGATYDVSAVALVGGLPTPVANVLPLTMPNPNAPTLVTAYDTSSVSGAALAAPPPGVTYDSVGGAGVGEDEAVGWFGLGVCFRGML